MARFEVHIPSATPDGFNVTFRLEAEHWMAALKLGMAKLGEQGTSGSNVLVDILPDESIDVTDAASGRVFRIRELPEETPSTARSTAAVERDEPSTIRLEAIAPPAEPVAAGPSRSGGETPTEREMPAVVLPNDTLASVRVEQPVAPAVPAEPRAATDVEAPRRRAVRLPAIKDEASAPAKPMPEGPARSFEPPRVEPLERPSRPITGAIGRPGPATRQVELLTELFERTQEVFEMREPRQALSFLLDLALEKIPCDAGSVFFADLGSTELTLLVARGPRAAQLEQMGLRIPMGVGVVGFCAQEAVSVAISDTEQDPRFYREVSERIGYETRSILCAPMVSGGRTFGCLELINKRESSTFTEAELGLLGYIAHQGARFLEQQR